MVVQLDELRSVLKKARQAAADGDAEEAASDIDAALAMLDDDPLLTPEQAADIVGIEEPLVITIWCRRGKLRCEGAHEGVLVPRSEAERFRESDEAARMRWSDAMHRAAAGFGLDRATRACWLPSGPGKHSSDWRRPGRLWAFGRRGSSPT